MNKFELQGTVKKVKDMTTGDKAKMLFLLDVTNGKHKNLIPLITFDKTAVWMAEQSLVGKEVKVEGRLQGRKTETGKYQVQMVVHFIQVESIKYPIQELKQTKKREVPSRSQTHFKEARVLGEVKQISLIDFEVVNIYPNVREAAKAIKVKKSALERAIEADKPLGGYLWNY